MRMKNRELKTYKLLDKEGDLILRDSKEVSAICWDKPQGGDDE